MLFIFGCTGSSLPLRLFSSGNAWVSRSGGFPSCRAQALGCTGFGGCSTRARWFWLPGSRAQAQQSWCTRFVAPPHVRSSRTGNQTHAPALAGAFFTTGPPPGKTLLCFFTFMLGVGIRVGRQGNSETSSKHIDIKTKTLSSEVKSKYQQKSFSSK